MTAALRERTPTVAATPPAPRRTSWLAIGGALLLVVAAFVQRTQLVARQEPTLADEVGRDEAVSAPASALEMLCQVRVIGNTAIIHGNEEEASLPGRRVGGGPGQRAGRHWCVTAHRVNTRDLGGEVRQRQLVAIRGARDEATFGRIASVDVVKQQRDGPHQLTTWPRAWAADCAADPMRS